MSTEQAALPDRPKEPEATGGGGGEKLSKNALKVCGYTIPESGF